MAVLALAWGGGPGGRAADVAVIDQTATLCAAGRFDEALDLLREESRAIKKADGDESARLLPINDLAAEILIDKGDLEKAAALLDKTIPAHEKLVAAGRHEQAAALGTALLSLARLETAAQRMPAAADAARRALLVFAAVPEPVVGDIGRGRDALRAAVDAIDGLLGPAAAATRAAREEAATGFLAAGLFSEAIEQRRKILAGLVAQDGAGVDDLQDASTRLGRLMLVAGCDDEAVAVMEQALAALALRQPREATSVRRLLGDVQLAADRLAGADRTCDMVLEASRSETPPAPVVEAGDRLRCLLVDLRSGAANGLPEWFDAALKKFSKPQPADVPAGIAGLVAAGRVREAVSQPAAAVDAFSRALALANIAKPVDSALVAELSSRLAAAQVAAGDAAAAAKTAEQALAAATRDLGPGDARAGLLRILLVEARERQGKTTDATALAGEALARGLPRPGEAWEEQTTALYDRLSAAGAADLRDRFIAARTAQFGERHPHVAAACVLFGAARLAAGDWPAAEALLSRAVDIQRASRGEEHPDTATSLMLLAEAQRATGQSQQAVETARRGMAAWEKVAGPGHPETSAVADVLVAAQVQAGDASGLEELLERLCAVEPGDDPSRLAAHLVRLADMTVARDPARALDLLERALLLPCWQAKAVTSPAVRLRLASAAALAAHAFQAAGNTAAATDALQRARALAIECGNPKPVLDRIERVAARGDLP